MIVKRDTLMIIIVSYSSFLNEAFLRLQKKFMVFDAGFREKSFFTFFVQDHLKALPLTDRVKLLQKKT